MAPRSYGRPPPSPVSEEHEVEAEEDGRHRQRRDPEGFAVGVVGLARVERETAERDVERGQEEKDLDEPNKDVGALEPQHAARGSVGGASGRLR